MADLNDFDKPVITDNYVDCLDTLRENIKRVNTKASQDFLLKSGGTLTGPIVISLPGAATLTQAITIKDAPDASVIYHTARLRASGVLASGLATAAGALSLNQFTAAGAAASSVTVRDDGTIGLAALNTDSVKINNNIVWNAANFVPSQYAKLGVSASFGTGDVTCGSVVASNWLRVSTADTGIYSNVHALGLMMKSDRLAVYGAATYFQVNTLLATGAVYAYWSDERLKVRTIEIQGAIERLSRLDAFLFKNNDTARKYGFTDDNERMGLSAQQVQQEFPQAVGLAPFDIGERGESLSGENYLTIQYENLVPALVAAVKELNLKINLVSAQRLTPTLSGRVV